MQQSKRPLLIGITGNIGSGKSTFCDLLMAAGIKVLQADEIAKKHLHDPQVVRVLSQRFGPVVLDNDIPGTIDKKALAKLIFIQPAEVRFLNYLLHPLVLQDMQNLAETSQEDYLIFEVPLLFEANLQDCFDYLVLVTCTEEIRQIRLKARGDRDAQQRAEYQISDQEKINKVDRVIDNNLSIDHLQIQTGEFISEIPHIPYKSTKPFSTNHISA